MWTGICVSSFSTASTASVQRDRRTSPVLRSIVARMSFSWPYLARPAFWMACSIASSTSSRSIDFSRATASATRSSSGRVTAVSISVRPLSWSRWWLRGRGDQRVGQHELGAANVGERQGHFRAVVEPHPRVGLVGAQHDAGEPLAAVDRRDRLRPGEVAGEAVPVLDPGQRPVDPGRADLQVPGPGDRVLHVQQGAERVADRLAILDARSGRRRRGRPSPARSADPGCR